MRILQLISISLLTMFILMKLNVININLKYNILHYLLKASLLLTFFSIIFPLVSYIKLKRMDVNKTQFLNDILGEIDPNQNVEIFITDKFMKNNAAVLYRRNQPVIVCGDGLVNSLSREQLKFLIAHEYYHIKKNHMLKNILSFIFVLAGVPILLLTISPYLISLKSLFTTLIISFILYVSSFILHFVFSQRRELSADRFASSFVGKECAKETLSILQEQKLVPEKSYSLFETHPSIKKRIENIS
jgi:Zn-dependent protease with chaperone function